VEKIGGRGFHDSSGGVSVLIKITNRLRKTLVFDGHNQGIGTRASLAANKAVPAVLPKIVTEVPQFVVAVKRAEGLQANSVLIESNIRQPDLKELFCRVSVQFLLHFVCIHGGLLRIYSPFFDVDLFYARLVKIISLVSRGGFGKRRLLQVVICRRDGPIQPCGRWRAGSSKGEDCVRICFCKSAYNAVNTMTRRKYHMGKYDVTVVRIGNITVEADSAAAAAAIADKMPKEKIHWGEPAVTDAREEEEG